MSDQRRNRRPDSRQLWDDSDRRDRHEPRDRDYGRDRDRNRDQERRTQRSRSRDRRAPRERSRSPDRRYRERDSERGRGGRGRGGDRDRDGRNGPRRHDDRDVRDRRRDEPEGRDRRGQGNYRDGSHRRSASPHRGSPPPSPRTDSTLPTRSRPDKKPTSMAFKVNRRSTSPSHSGGAGRNDDGDVPMRGADDGHRAGQDDGGRSRRDGDDEDEDDVDVEVEGDDDMAAMQAMLGFGGFGTTKNKKIKGNDVGAVRKEKKTEYRQYMNRQGGFNRPLSPGR